MRQSLTRPAPAAGGQRDSHTLVAGHGGEGYAFPSMDSSRPAITPRKELS
jgi:hypothetical protein